MGAPVVCSRINFRSPFSLKGVAAVQPAGFYNIETEEKHYWTFPFSWDMRARTVIRLNAESGVAGASHEFEMDPRDLFAAMERDRLVVA